ncbi:MAG TPA: PEP/pyruvate-binding domain-containing protein, partial [Leptospiraceae bacterium]|nr:PEP/pyruvate-binding domain-containing protein [Leptospiraceae bacterium]
MNFNSKADTLHSLENILQKGKILPQICFSAKNFETKIHSVVEEISERGWDKISLIVRSSGASEDGQNESLAGHFSSVPDVNGPNELKKAVQKVAQSFKDVKEQDQIFIQPMLQNVTMSGVAFSSDPNLGSEYIIINYDEESGSTSSVTSGTSN